MRKLVQDQLTRKKCTLFEDIQLHQRRLLIQNLFHSPEKFIAHLKRLVWTLTTTIAILKMHRFVTAVVLEIAYGRRVVSDDDQFLINAATIDELVAASGTTGLVILDFIPIREGVHESSLMSVNPLLVSEIRPIVGSGCLVFAVCTK